MADKVTRVLGYKERTEIVMEVHYPREDQMGDTTRDVVLARKVKALKEHELEGRINSVMTRG